MLKVKKVSPCSMLLRRRKMEKEVEKLFFAWAYLNNYNRK